MRDPKYHTPKGTHKSYAQLLKEAAERNPKIYKSYLKGPDEHGDETN